MTSNLEEKLQHIGESVDLSPEQFYVKLPNHIFNDTKIENEEFTTLLLIFRHYIPSQNIALCSIGMLMELLGTHVNYDNDNFRTIKKSLLSLLSNGYIDNLYDLRYNKIKVENITNKNYLFYVELPELPKKEFFMVYNTKINTILEFAKGTRYNKYAIIRYYCACCRVINSQTKVGYLSHSILNRLIVHAKTFQNYNKILEDDLHLLRFNSNYLTKDCKYHSTFVGLYEIGKDTFDAQVDVEVQAKGLVYTDKKVSNKKRSLKQKINRLIEDGEDALIAENEELKAKLAEYEKLQYQEKAKEELPESIEANDGWGEFKQIILNNSNEVHDTKFEELKNSIKTIAMELTKAKRKDEYFSIVDSVLGTGGKVSEATIEQYHELELILNKLNELDLNGNETLPESLRITPQLIANATVGGYI